MKIFTIVLTVVVIAVAILFILLSKQRRGHGVPRWKAEMAAFELSLERYKYDFGEYPTGSSIDISHAITGKSPGVPKYFDYKERQISEGVLIDPWGRPYVFSIGVDGIPVIRSLGKDGITSDDDKTNR
jgi:type II secretory pathway pseudopilin PulG